MPPKKGKKNGSVLPPKPSTMSEEQWELAHSASKLLERLALPESSRGTSASKVDHAKPLANKQTAALWLWQLVSTSPEARDEANKAGAVEICAKLVGAHSSSATTRSSIITNSTPGSQEALQAYCLGTITQLAVPSAGSQSAAVREALLTVRPLVLPGLLSHIAEASSTSLIAAAVGLLAVLTGCPDTHGKAKKIMAGWNKRPLIKALTMQHSLPLGGGRHAAADAAAVLQAICSPTPPQDAPAAAAAGGDGKEGASNKDGKGAKDSGSAGKSPGSAAAASVNPAEAAAEASLTAVVQESVLAAGGLEGLLHICGKVGSPPAARTAAAKAACHLMAAHGVQQQVKDAFKAAGGISIMVRLLPDQHLPLQARAAAAGCIWHYLAPKPTTSEISSSSAQAAAASDAVGDGAGSVLGCAHPTSSPGDAVFGLPSPVLLGSPSVTVSKPLVALTARSNLITAAKNMRKKSAMEEHFTGPSSTSSTVVDGSDAHGGVVAAAAVGSASARLSLSAAATAVSSTTDGSTPAVEAAASSAYNAAIAAWDYAIAAGDLATRAEHVIAARCVPALLLLCCGPDGAPPAVLAAAEAAATTACAVSTDSSAATDGLIKSPSDSHDVSSTCTGTAEGSSSISRGAGGASRGGLATDLDAIAEPSHGEMEESDDAAAAAGATAGNAGSQVGDSSSRGSRAAGGQQGGKKKKAGKKKGGVLEPGMAEAQIAASAALKLLAMSGDTGRAALAAAGVQQVLVQLLTGSTAAARWNARQVLVLLSLSPLDKRPKEARNSGSKQRPANISSADALGGGRSRAVSALADSAAEAETAAAAAAVPAYISMVNLPASHWQRMASLQMPPLPPLPMIPGRRTAGGSEPQQNTGAAAAGCAECGAGSAGSSAGLRPGSQQRRMSLTSAAGAVLMGSRMSTSSSVLGDSGGAGCDAAVGLSKLSNVARLSSGVPPGSSSGMISAVGSMSGATGV